MWHVETYGCLAGCAASAAFVEYHMAEAKSNQEIVDISATRGAMYNTVIVITQKQLAEEIAAELFTWPDEWTPYESIEITSKRCYYSITLYDGKVVSDNVCRITFRCQLKTKSGSTASYYQAYHFVGLA